MEKGYLDHNNQRPVAATAANVTPLATKAVENTIELLLHKFDPTEKNILNYLDNFQYTHTKGIITSWWPTTMMRTIFLQHRSIIE